jgi:murein DD-endopeptidase MepM/ murein hydrolase activator NlpD
MKRARKQGGSIAAIVAGMAIGVGIGWTLRGHAPQPQGVESPVHAEASGKDSRPPFTVAATTGAASPIEDLRSRGLRVPIDGASVESFKGQFADRRENGDRPHEAVDILSPRNTPVHAADDGTVAKLFFSKGGGGNTIYEFDPSKRYCYYYAHL